MWDVDYSALTSFGAMSAEYVARMLARTEKTRPCTHWEFQDTQYGDTLIQEASLPFIIA